MFERLGSATAKGVSSLPPRIRKLRLRGGRGEEDPGWAAGGCSEDLPQAPPSPTGAGSRLGLLGPSCAWVTQQRQRLPRPDKCVCRECVCWGGRGGLCVNEFVCGAVFVILILRVALCALRCVWRGASVSRCVPVVSLHKVCVSVCVALSVSYKHVCPPYPAPQALGTYRATALAGVSLPRQPLCLSC